MVIFHSYVKLPEGTSWPLALQVLENSSYILEMTRSPYSSIVLFGSHHVTLILRPSHCDLKRILVPRCWWISPMIWASARHLYEYHSVWDHFCFTLRCHQTWLAIGHFLSKNFQFGDFPKKPEALPRRISQAVHAVFAALGQTVSHFFGDCNVRPFRLQYLLSANLSHSHRKSP